MLYVPVLILFSVTLLFDPSVYLPYYTPKVYLLILSVMWLAFAFLVLRLFFSKNRVVKFSRIEILLFSLFIWRIISNYSILNNRPAFLLLVSQIIIVFVLRQYSANKKLKIISLVLYSLFYLGIIQSALGLYQYFSFPLNTHPSFKTPVIGTIGLPNAFGATLAVSVISTFVLMITSKRIFFRIACLISILFFSYILYLNGSRGAILALTVSLIIFAFVYIYKNFHRFRFFLQLKWMRYFYVSTMFLFVILFTVMLYNKDKESSAGRLMIWQISLPMFTENPLSGIGYGNYSMEYLNYQARFFYNSENHNLIHKATNLKQAHNEYLEAFCETGLIGGGLFLLLLTFSFLYILKSLINPAENRYFYYNLALLSLFLIIILHGFVDDTLHFFPTNILFFVVVGLIPAPTVKFTVKSFKTVYKLVPLILFFVFNIYISAFLFNQYQGYRFWAEGQQKVKANRSILAIPYFERALQKIPANGELLFHYGSALTFTGKYNKGLYYLEKSLKNFNDRNIYLSKSYAYLKLYDLHKAEKQAKIALSMFPDHLAPHLLLGQIYYKMNDIKRSKRSLLKCIKMETKIKSRMVSQIQVDAQRLWWKYYGN